MLKIFKLESARPMDGQWWEVGGTVYVKNKPIEITEIKDESTDFDNGVHIQFNIMSNGEYIQTLVNMPVIITYYTTNPKEESQ